MKLNTQPMGGTVDTERGVLFSNDTGKEIVITSLSFCNIGSDADVRIEVFQPYGDSHIKLGQATLSAGERLVFDSEDELHLSPDDKIAAKAAVKTIEWRVNLKEA